MKIKLSRREIIIIAAFWLVGCLLMGVVAYLIVYQTPAGPGAGSVTAPQATYTLTHTQITAKSMYPATAGTLSLWADDAQLYSVTATWPKTELNMVGEAAAWTYRYYSPEQKRLFFITVNPDGVATGTSHGERVYNAPLSVPAEAWQVDSSTALNTWLNYGGAAMLAAMPGTQVVIQLQVSTPAEPLTWTIAGFDQVTKQYHTVSVNAQNGKVIKIASSLAQQ